MDANSTIARPAYFLAALFFFVPLFDVAAVVWPLHPGLEQWRFGALGALSNYTLLPLGGLLLALITARTNNHRAARRILGWLCALFAVILLAFTLLFVLDYLQARSSVRPEYAHTMAVAAATAGAKLVLTILALTILAPAGITGPKHRWKEGDDPERPATPLIPVMGAARRE